ncbi:hypothetical protein E2C01_052641 [Portunus trituberculatus]|uniref:Uncharacterized protein n=1 Tax=Portunus trituberculatus TaxID=210409 RepID=A0A5B7GPY4_PORTR|nr:hypothetical protein [Portunus trituberculatus]
MLSNIYLVMRRPRSTGGAYPHPFHSLMTGKEYAIIVYLVMLRRRPIGKSFRALLIECPYHVSLVIPFQESQRAHQSQSEGETQRDATQPALPASHCFSEPMYTTQPAGTGALQCFEQVYLTHVPQRRCPAVSGPRE